MKSLDPILISALQHFLFCERQFALIHLEQLWAENRFTAEGQVLHKNAHEGEDESRPGVRITRGLKVGSKSMGISGVCDVVEFHGRKPNFTRLVPIEYKRGKPKSHQADELQLCAQALCLEEMMQIPISHGYIFYGKTRRRTEVSFDAQLRELLHQTIASARAMFDSGITPAPNYEPSKCGACSLNELCLPQLNRRKRGADSWFRNQLQMPGD